MKEMLKPNKNTITLSTLLTSFCAVLPGIAGVPAVTVDTGPAYSPSRETAGSQQHACGGTSGPLSEG